jgi:hypothetical protein
MDKFHMKKSEALGVNFSTATARLKLQVTLQLLKECGRNKCYRCNKEIEIATDLSLDHKEDWLNSNKEKELFWDLNNVAYSHKSCNIKAGLNKRTNFRGVTKLKNKNRNKRFQARKYENGKQILVGYFSTAEEAMKALTAT